MIYANVGPDGVIVFEPRADPALKRLPLARASDKHARKFKQVLSGMSRHAYDGETLLVPGMPEAEDQNGAMDALLRFREFVDMALTRAQVS